MSQKLKLTALLLGSVALLAFIPKVREVFLELIALFQSLDVENIKIYILSFGIGAPLISFALMMFQSIIAPLPRLSS